MTDHIANIDITRKRGDNFPFQLTLKDSGGTAVDITGFTFRMVADPSNAPADDTNNLFDLAGVIVTAEDGIFQFEPTTSDMDVEPGTYFYEVQMIDASSKVRSIVAGTFIVEQDIVK